MPPSESPPGEQQRSIDDVLFEGQETPLLLRWRVIASIATVLVVVVAGYLGASAAFGFPTQIDAEPFRDWVEEQGPLGPIVFIAVMAVSVLFAPIPNAPVFVAAGLAWGPVLGTAYSLIGLMLGSTGAFWIARRLGRKWLPRLIGARNAVRIDSVADSMGGRVVFAARMLPIVNFDWLSYVAGVTSIRFWVFALASLLGMIVPTAAAVVAGDGLGRDIRITAVALGAWLGAVLLSAAYYYWRRRRYLSRRRAAEAAPGPLPRAET